MPRWGCPDCKLVDAMVLYCMYSPILAGCDLLQATAVEDLTPGRPWRPGTGWNKRKNYLDNDNNGYTK